MTDSTYDSTTDSLTSIGSHYYFTSTLLKNMASDEGKYIDIFNVDNADNATAAFSNIAMSIKEAATDVKVEDQMGDDFTMIFDAPNTTVENLTEGQDFYIEITDYVLNPVKDANGNIIDYTRGTGTSLMKLYLGTTDNTYYAASDANGTAFATPTFDTTALGNMFYWSTDATKGDPAIAVTVGDTTYYFVSDGTGTHNMISGAYAFGNLVTQTIECIDASGGKTIVENTVCNDLIIATPYFVYNAETKVMVWTVAKLTSSEIAMTYFLYLDNSGGLVGSEEEAEAGTYETNEYAYLTYKNHLETECKQEFPVPQITWNGAQVSYVFYLVNEQGQPVNRAGRVVPFSEAVYVTDVFTYSMVWNDLERSESLEAEMLASDRLPTVFKLYDSNAAYKIHVFEDESGSNLNNHFQIAGSKAVNTTYVFNAKSDAEKYSAPGTYAENKEYKCKYYVEATFSDDGTLSSVSEPTDVTPVEFAERPSGADYYSTLTKHAYFIEETDEGTKVYTIVQNSDAQTVRSGFDFANTTVAFAVLWLPRLETDTVVIDFGLDVDIDVSQNDGLTGAVTGVMTSAPSGLAINTGTYDNSKASRQIDVTANIAGQSVKVATATQVNNSTVNFSLDKDNGMLLNQAAIFYYESQVSYYQNSDTSNLNTEYMYSSVIVIPASTVYYEDEYVDLKTYVRETYEQVAPGTEFNDKVTYYTLQNDKYIVADIDAFAEGVTYYTLAKDYTEHAGWDTNSVNASAVQAVDRPGHDMISASYDANNPYGYDSAYETMSTYSMGNAAMVQVQSGKYATAEFEFYGTGFDVISATSVDTGVITVDVYQYDSNNGYIRIPSKCAIVDTYYGYELKASTDSNGNIVYNWVVCENDEEILYQVPVIKVDELDYGKYKVKITINYYSVFDHHYSSETSENSYDFYLDAIRIYDPVKPGTVVGKDAEQEGKDVTIEDIYAEDNEGWPIYEELRNNIISAGSFGFDGSSYTTYSQVDVEAFEEGVTYYTKSEDGVYTEVTGEYNSDTEYYVVDTCYGVVFIDCNDANTRIADYISYGPNNELYLANNQAIAFNVTVPENVADIQLGIKVANGDSVTYEINGDSYTVNTATDMYYTILDYAKGTTPVVIKNVSGGILSLTNIKVTHTSAPATESGISLLSMDGESAGIALMMLRRAPVVEEEIPDSETTEPSETTNPSEPEESDPIEPSKPEETDPTEPSKPEETEPTEPSKPEETDPTEPSKPEDKPFDPDKVEMPFKDVPKGKWFHAGVAFVYHHKLMNGMKEDAFGPSDAMTRAMVVTVLYRLAGSPKTEYDAKYSDIPANKYYTDAVNWAAEKGIAFGVGNNKFDPNGDVTREQLATMLYRYSQLMKYDLETEEDLLEFPDFDQVNKWSKDGMKWAVGKGIINGVKNGSKNELQPGSNALRSQIAVILQRFCESFE